MIERYPHHALSRAVIGAFYEVYNHLGYGLLERVHAMALEQELRDRGLRVAREVNVPVYYKGRLLTTQRVDMVVEGVLVVEIKSTELVSPSAMRQLVSYLRSTHLEVGLLMHFGPDPKVRRAIYTKRRRPPPAPPANEVQAADAF